MSRNEKIIRVLASLMGVVFAAILVLRLSPYGFPESGVVVDDAAEMAQTSSHGDDSESDAHEAVPGQTGESDDEAMHETVYLTLTLEDGPVRLELWPDVAPQHVERVTTLAREGFYNGIVFHRVIEGFMAQTGDPTGTGAGGSDLPDLPAEFSDVPFERGTLGMARTQDPNSANSQFFIMFADAPHLNGQYTVFGRVVEGMENVDAIKRGDVAANGLVENPDRIISLSPELE